MYICVSIYAVYSPLQAQRLIEDEVKRYRPAKNYLDYLPVPATTFITPLVQAELDRLSARQPMETLSMKRFICMEGVVCECRPIHVVEYVVGWSPTSSGNRKYMYKLGITPVPYLY